MALVICGQLCSGKSTAAACLADDIETMDPKPTVGIVDESSFHLGRNQSYAGTRSLISINSTMRYNVVITWVLAPLLPLEYNYARSQQTYKLKCSYR